MASYFVLGFAGVGLTVFIVAWVTLAILVLALVAAASYSFFRSVGQFDDGLHELTMELDPATRRLFFARYASLHPKDPAVAWFLAVGLGPIGANLYRQKWGPFVGALLTLNGLGAWWLESIYTTPHLVAIENRALMAYALQLVREEQGHASPDVREIATPPPAPAPPARDRDDAMNGDFVFLVFATLVPPIWLAIGLIGLALRSKRRIL